MLFSPMASAMGHHFGNALVSHHLNPDPSGGFSGPPLGDEWWYPMYEKMQELDVPAMLPASEVLGGVNA